MEVNTITTVVCLLIYCIIKKTIEALSDDAEGKNNDNEYMLVEKILGKDLYSLNLKTCIRDETHCLLKKSLDNLVAQHWDR